MLLIGIAIAAFCATFAGGLFALRLQDKLHMVLGFSAGAVIAVAFFDLLPEAIELGGPRYGVSAVLAWSALGFLAYLVLDRVQWLRGRLGNTASKDLALHLQGADPGHKAAAGAMAAQRGVLGAGSLSAHSLLDGIAIGLAFQASHSAGIVVTIGVLTHDVSDGMNTLSVILKNQGTRDHALRWLWADALAPALGIGSTFLFTLPPSELGVVLALFAGFFLYIGASDLVPESFHAHPQFLTTLMTLLGAAVLYLAVALASR
jgi:zinc transporter ZupT